jgi:phosphoglycerate dehydrogenase-like enzyme
MSNSQVQVSSGRLRILNQLTEPFKLVLPADLQEKVEVLPVPKGSQLDPALRGDVLLGTWGNPQIYELAERVPWVHYTGTGLDGLDVRRLSQGRVLTNSRGVAAIPIAEWVLTMLLLHEKRVDEVLLKEPPERWPVRTPLGTLHGRRIALLGLGAIGTAVAVRALPFGASVRALRRSPQQSEVAGIELVPSFEELLKDAEHLILAAPLTDATRHIVNRESLRHAKPGLHIVNIARGDLIDQDALRVALDSGLVGGASLDAVTPEPPPAGHWLYTHPRVKLSPHLSWSWPGAAATLAEKFVENLRLRLSGRPLLNVIDPERGY